METVNKHEGWATTKKERRNYGMYFMGQNMIYFLDYMFLATFLLMSGLEATKTAVILIVVKVWDAVNDCLFGNIVDEIKFKKGGKFLPWLKLSTPLVGVTTLLLFGIPLGLNVTAKLIWFAVAYILWDAAYTMCDTPIFGMVTTMTDNQEERTSLMTTGRIFANIGVLLCMILGYTLPSQAIGISYTWLAVIVVVISMTLMAFEVFKGKEHTPGSRNEEKSYTLKQMFKYLGNNKYLLIFYLGIVFIQGLNTASAVLVFTCYYLFDNEMIATAISLLSFFPSVIIGFLLPTILKKVDKFAFFIWSNVAYAILSVIIWIVGPHLVSHLILSIIRGFAFGGFTVVQFMFTPDCAEYGQYKTGIEAKGITFAIQTFTQKLVSAISSALGVAILGWFGWQTVNAKSFAELAASGVTQSASALTGLWTSYALVPAIGGVIAVLVWIFMYKLKTSDVEVMAKFNDGLISREECEAKLSRKY